MKLVKQLFLLAGLSLMIGLSTSAQEGWVSLKGKLKGFNNQVAVEDMSEFQYLVPPTADRMIIPDSAGNFKLKFKLAQANYYRLGRNALYLTPGDDLDVVVDYSDPTKAVFNGKGALANTYLKHTPFPKGGSFLEAGAHVKNTPEETIAVVEELAKTRAKELAATTGVSPVFRRLETARIKADLINSLISGAFYSTYKLKLKDDAAKEFTERYKAAITPKIKSYSQNFTDPFFMKLVVYRDVAENVIEQGGKPADIQTIKDYFRASELVKDMQKVSDKKMLVPFKQKIADLKTPAYQRAVNQMLQHQMAYGKGDPVIDFVATNLNGEKISLSSLKGKVIYVDLWATWCGPCLQEMPSYEKLKQQYKDNPNVVFVSLSIDDNEALWKENIAQRKAEGQQWLINRSKLQAYNIVGIPRSLLIDQQFKMVDMAAPLPSQPAATKAIDALLK